MLKEIDNNYCPFGGKVGSIWVLSDPTLPIFGPAAAHLGLYLYPHGLHWSHLGANYSHVGANFSHLGANLGSLGPCWANLEPTWSQNG